VSQFTTPLKVMPLENGRWELLEAFEYHVGSEDSTDVISVPVGFDTDFASIPRPLWPVFPPYDITHGKAAVIHDYLYRVQTRTRKQCDQIFLEAMTVLGAGWLKRTLMYQSVRWFAGGAWNLHREG